MSKLLRWIERNSWSWDWTFAVGALSKGEMSEAQRFRLMILDALFEGWESQYGTPPSEKQRQTLADSVDRRLREWSEVETRRSRPAKTEAQINVERETRQRVEERKQTQRATADQDRRFREKLPGRRTLDNPLWPRKQ